MNESELTTNSFRWTLLPSTLVFLILAIHQSYVVMAYTPGMIDLYSGFGAELSVSTQFAATWYWIGCVLTSGLTAIAACVILVKAKTGSYPLLKRWYFGAVAGVIGALLWSAFVLSAIYDPLFRMASPI